MALYVDNLSYFDEYIHVNGFYLSVKWSSLKNRTTKDRTIFNHGHPVSKFTMPNRPCRICVRKLRCLTMHDRPTTNEIGRFVDDMSDRTFQIILIFGTHFIRHVLIIYQLNRALAVFNGPGVKKHSFFHDRL